MDHETYREWLHLVIADEVTTEQYRRLEQHLRECDECRTEFHELRQLVSTLGERGAAEPSEQLLWEARRSLHEAIRKEPPMQSVLARVTQSVAPSVPLKSSTASRGPVRRWADWFYGFRFALTGLAAVVAGIFIGYLSFGRSAALPVTPVPTDQAQLFNPDADEHMMGLPEVANVRLVDTSDKDGKVAVEYDLVRPGRLRAGLDDPRMQRMLTYALLHEHNPGVRLQAINVLEANAEAPWTGAVAPDVKEAMIEAIKSDPNVGVRKQAMAFLHNVPFDSELKDMCLYVLLNDDNPGMRVESITMLAEAAKSGSITGEEVLDVLKTKLREEDEPFVRAQTAAFIQEVNDEQ